MPKTRYVPFIAILMLVVFRMAIGWQFLYEGLWKASTQSTPQPWSSVGFLRNAEGPFREVFREMTGDPNELSWLDEESVNARWSAWQKRFVDHYKLDENQQKRLDLMLNGQERYASDSNVYPLTELPQEVAEFLEKNKSWEKYIKFNADAKRLEVDGKEHLTPQEKAKLIDLAGLEEVPPLMLQPGDFKYQLKGGDEVEPTEVQIAFAKALDNVYDRQARLGFRERLKGTLGGNPEMVGDEYKTKIKDEAGEEKVITDDRKGNIEQYEVLLNRYESMRKDAKMAYNWVHLDYEKDKMNEKKSAAIGPVKALDKELRDAALKLVTLEQLSSGPVAPDPSPVREKDLLVMTGLVCLGICLISGFLTKLSALLAAIMIFSFYLVMPPLPGIPHAPGPDHSLFIDKNLIEVFALLTIAAFPTGRWFGLDAAIISWWNKRKLKSVNGKKTQSTSTAEPATAAS
ncbi:MAG: DoxX family protein [Planctomycetaceae bacterium]|nr:DoxX family protein [Planctomycetaceae bacterium]